MRWLTRREKPPETEAVKGPLRDRNSDSIQRRLRLLVRDLRVAQKTADAAMLRANSAYTNVSRLKSTGVVEPETATAPPSQIRPGMNLAGLIRKGARK